MSLKVFHNIKKLATLKGAAKKNGRHIIEADLSPILNAVMVSFKGKIVWVGPKGQFKKANLKKWDHPNKAKYVDLKGAYVMPGFVECHTHSVFSGDRSRELELRNKGVSYQQIATQGGGILNTVKATRKASGAELASLLKSRVQNFIQQGVTTLEVKSGYGLNAVTELKMLKAIKEQKKPRLVSTFLGAHARPKEFSTSSQYINELINKQLPTVKKQGLAHRVDIFIEKGYFTLNDAKKYINKAQSLGFPVCMHTEQLTRTGGALLGIKSGVQSVDHLVQVSQSDIKALSKAETTCVLLPGADFYLKMAYPPARKLIDAGARVALATDYNPGSCPTQSLSLIGLLSRLEMKMTLPEVLVAYTLGAAYSLGLEKEVGSLETGKSCDFVCLDQSWASLFYEAGHHPVQQTWWKSRKIY